MVFSLFLTLCLFNPQNQADVIESMKVDFVLLDVLALDKDGLPVMDLTKDDFEIKENKKKVTVQVFDILDFSIPAAEDEGEADATDSTDEQEVPMGSEAAEPPSPAQTVIMLLELSNAEHFAVSETMNQVGRFLTDLQGRPNLQIFIFSMDKGLITKDFTPSPEKALADFNAFKETYLKDSTRNLSVVRATTLASFEENLDDCKGGAEFVAQQQNRAPGESARLSKDQIIEYLGCLVQRYDVFTKTQTQRTRSVLFALENLIAGFSKVQGLKSLYLVSPGFSLYPGQTAANMARAYQDRVVGRFSPGQSQDVGSPFGNPDDGGVGDGNPNGQRKRVERPPRVSFSKTSLVDEYERVTHAAVAQRVVFNTFTVPMDYAQIRQGAGAQDLGLADDALQYYSFFGEEQNTGLAKLAEFTGGIPRFGRNLAEELRATVEGSRYFYVLGYETPKGNAKKFRKISIKCKRNGVTLHHRQGYHPDPEKLKR